MANLRIFLRRMKRRAYVFFWKLNQSSEFESEFLRKLYRDLYGVDVGLYSYGCFDPRRIDPYTRIGRYCSFASTVYRFNGNHGKNFLTLHPYAYNIDFGIVQSETIVRSECFIEDDVWVGHNAIILPSVKNVGRGAIIGAGAVVTKDVPPYSIVVGNPAVVKGYRFEPDVIEMIEDSQWWTMSKDELAKVIRDNPDFVFNPQQLKNLG